MKLFTFFFTDRLEKNLINEAIARDEKDNFNNAPSARQNANLNKHVEAIRSCGVSFGVWEKKCRWKSKWFAWLDKHGGR